MHTHPLEYFAIKVIAESEKFIIVIRKSFKAVKILVFYFYIIVWSNIDFEGQFAQTILRKKHKAGGVDVLTDKTKLQESKQYGVGTRNRHQMSRKNRELRIKSMPSWSIES